MVSQTFLKNKAHGPHRSPEKYFLTIYTEQSLEYKNRLVKGRYYSPLEKGTFSHLNKFESHPPKEVLWRLDEIGPVALRKKMFTCWQYSCHISLLSALRNSVTLHLTQEKNPHFSFCWNATFSDLSVTEMCGMAGTFQWQFSQLSLPIQSPFNHQSVILLLRNKILIICH